MRRWRTSLVAIAMLLAACNIQTAGAPSGDTDLFATFDDVQDLTAGHNVQASNVVVGSVRELELDGYRARVRMSIVDDFRVPVGVAAVIRRTSLLGEYYVDLVLPDDAGNPSGYLGDGDAIEDATTQRDVEDLAAQAAAVVGALTADDLGSTISAAADGLGGRGQKLNELVRDAAQVAAVLADQQVAIESTVDSLATLGATLAPDADQLVRTVDRLATASGTVADSRDRIVAALDALVELATATNDTVLEPHSQRLADLLGQLQPMLGTLADRNEVLVDLLIDLDRFVRAFPTAVHNGSVLLLMWAYLPAGVQGFPLGDAAGDPLDALDALVRAP